MHTLEKPILPRNFYIPNAPDLQVHFIFAYLLGTSERKSLSKINLILFTHF